MIRISIFPRQEATNCFFFTSWVGRRRRRRYGFEVKDFEEGVESCGGDGFVHVVGEEDTIV